MSSQDDLRSTPYWDENADAWVPAATSPGGSSSLLSATLTLDDAGIRALSDDPAVIIPATTIIDYDPSITPDVVFRPIAATVVTKIVTGYLVAGDLPEIVLAYSSDWANNASSRAPITVGLTAAGTWQCDLPCPSTVAPDVPSVANLGLTFQPINGDWLDNAVALATVDAEISGGDSANTLTVTVLYIALAIT